MSLGPLRTAAAGYVLDAFGSEDLRRFADEALSRGVYSETLGELGTSSSAMYSEVRPFFLTALVELGVPLPSEQEAIERMVMHHMGGVMEGAVSPFRGIGAVLKLISAEIDCLDPPVGYPEEDRCRIVRLDERYDTYRSLTDLFRERRRNRTDPDDLATTLEQAAGEMRRIAREWMTAPGRWRVDRSWLTWNNGAVRKLAQAIRDGRCFTDLPRLAAALEEAGCRDVDALEHCREQAPHLSECWVVQRLLADA